MDFYKSLKNTVRNVLAGATLLASLGAQAQAVWDVADTPLLGGDNLVAPNLIFMFDDSSSMTGFYGGQYPYCMDAYNLIPRFYGRTTAYPYLAANWTSWLWRNCSLYGSNQKRLLISAHTPIMQIQAACQALIGTCEPWQPTPIPSTRCTTTPMCATCPGRACPIPTPQPQGPWPPIQPRRPQAPST